MDSKLINFDQLEFNITKDSPFISTDYSIANTINCLVESFNLYYEYVSKVKHQFKEGKQPEVKDHLYSMYLKSLLAIVNSINEIALLDKTNKPKNEKCCGSSISTKSKESLNDEKTGDKIREILDSLSKQPLFFSRFAGLFNFLTFDVSYLLIF